MSIFLRGRGLVEGLALGEAIVVDKPISFLGDVDPRTGEIVGLNGRFRGTKVTGKILVFPHSKGSTVGSYIIYELSRRKLAPLAMVVRKAEPIIIVGCVLAGIPLIDNVTPDPLANIRSGDNVRVDAYRGIVEVLVDE